MGAPKIVRLLALSVSLLGTAPAIAGVFALQGGTQKANGHLAVSAIQGHPLERELNSWMTRNGSATPIRSYETDMTKLLHGVIVSDDFTTFLHVHPLFSKNGHFTLEQRFPRPALYHVYADGEPLGIGQQVFRFDLNVGSPRKKNAARELMPTGSVAIAGPYTVTLSSLRLSTHGETMLRLRITRGGKLARDLHPYLGTLGHAVFLNGKDLTYVHVHPMALGAESASSPMSPNATMPSKDMQMGAPPLASNAVTSPSMLLHVAVREAGTYKLWFQFRGGDALRVASFVLTAT